MVPNGKRALIGLIVLIAGFCSFSCKSEPKEEGRLKVTGAEYVLRQDKPHAYVIDARGKIKNVGKYDVRRVVVTGNCVSCGEEIIVGKWFVSDIDKTDKQKYTISYIAVGGEEEFSFQDLAFIYNKQPEAPEHMPDDFEIVIESFETVYN